MVFAMGPLDRDDWLLALGTAYAPAGARERKRSDWLLAGAENWSSLFGLRTLWRGDRNPSATIRRMNPSEVSVAVFVSTPPVSWPPVFFFVLLFVSSFSLLAFSVWAFGSSSDFVTQVLFTASTFFVFECCHSFACLLVFLH